MSGNKGEWSELYVLLKLLADGKLLSGDADLNVISDLAAIIKTVIRQQNNGEVAYNLIAETAEVEIVTGEIHTILPVSYFHFWANALLIEIKSDRDKNGAFEIPSFVEVMRTINATTLKAKSSKKSDIILNLEKFGHELKASLGFSIKSKLGSASTLLNAGKTTNIIYKITNNELIPELEAKINSIESKNKVKDRITKLIELGYEFVFESFVNRQFENNLRLIDTSLPSIVAELVFSYFATSSNKIKDLARILALSNTQLFDNDLVQYAYGYKIKKFLTEAALGMTPGAKWEGEYDATGGYLVVKENGDILCYFVYDKNLFEEYLFKNTKLDTASTNRYDYGYVYEENGNFYIKLNLQVRFC